MEAQENVVVDNEKSTSEKVEIYTICMEVKRVKGEKNGKKYDFLAYSGADKHGKRCKFKFTKDVDNMPKEEGIFDVEIARGMINKDKSSVYNDYWVRGVVGYTTYDGFKGADEDLPF